ncbi:TlpA family protein disulfide reductase [Chloroflexota bacterium]
MKKSNINKLLISALFAALLFTGWGCGPGTNTASSIQAPPFQLVNLEGTTVTLEDYAGHVVFLNFWATWCPPCRLEMPFIDELASSPAYQGKVAFVTINGGESSTTVTDFMEKHGYDFTVLLDTDMSVSQIYNVRSIPSTFIIDNNGIVKHTQVGAFTSKDQLSNLIDQYID